MTGVHGTTPVAGRRSGGPWIWLDSHPGGSPTNLPPLDGLSSVTLDSPCDIISHWPGRPLPLHPDEALRRGATAENVELFFHPYEGP